MRTPTRITKLSPSILNIEPIPAEIIGVPSPNVVPAPPSNPNINNTSIIFPTQLSEYFPNIGQQA